MKTLVCLTLVQLFSVISNAYILPLEIILQKNAVLAGTSIISVEQDVTFKDAYKNVVVKETWLIEGDRNLRLTAKGAGELRDSLSIAAVYNNRNKTTLSGKSRLSRAPGENFFEKYLAIKSKDSFMSYIKELGISQNVRAGIAKTFPFIEFPLDNWLATLNINLTGTLLCSQHAARLMVRRRWGRIINIASVAGMRAVGKGRTAYGTSKAAVIGLTRQIASELAEEGVTANAIAPGPVATPMTDVLHSPEFRAAYTSAIPMKRYGRPEEIASIVSYLASESSAYITGAVIPVDGGLRRYQF